MKSFDSSNVLFGRARKHFTEYHKWEDAFRGKYRDSGFFENDPDTGDILLKAPRIEDPPIVGSGIVFDCINCLRSSLDHAVFAASIILGGNPNPKSTKFPFGIDADAAASDLPRKRAEMPECIRPHLLSYKPYKGGDNLLWGMNELRNGKIHQTLQAMVTLPFGALDGKLESVHVVHGLRDGATGSDDKVTLMRIRAGAKMDVKPRILAAVAFSQSGPFPGEGTDDLLEDMLDMISGILRGIEAETWRLAKASNP
jgi:hypothetical protein